MRYSSWKQIKDATPAERKLKDCAEAGEPCELGPHDKIPREPTDWAKPDENRHIRADVLRFLILSDTTTEKGIMIEGGYISDALDLSDCTIPRKCMFFGCRFEGPLFLTRSTIESDLRISNSALYNVDAAGSRIAGQLDFGGTQFLATEIPALNLQHAEVKESVLLTNTSFTSAAILAGIKIGGQLDFSRATFMISRAPPNYLFSGDTALTLERAEVKESAFFNCISLTATANLSGIRIGGQLDCTGAAFLAKTDVALFMRNAKVQSELIIKDLEEVNGLIDLSATYAGSLTDDQNSWPSNKKLILDGFTYDRIIGATDAKNRLDWLAKGDRCSPQDDEENEDERFFPQPYKQLAKVLHNMGHEADAREVLFTLEQKLSIERRNALQQDIKTLRQTAPKTGLDIARLLILGMERGKDWLLRSIIGYGYKPFRSLAALVLLVCLFWLFTLAAWHTGGFAPNSGVILTSPDWTALGTDHPNAAAAWAALAPAGQDWESFGSFAYALDVVIPIIEFGQTDAWAPSTSRGLAGTILWWARWPFTIAGWIVTALGAAALTGVIQRK
ncbi:hypothetical protein SAMN04488118_10877 [Epibacterium ulvae]|uniref:Pentapeptide repeat-containing protein n=1 Tax=Epibacterium ulvae TaxID=1156985 RepID=A0A1G5R3R0_9RHOB|nr:pentapeptide repeat-containing protein [Epibacterium ulvae]SCZ68724.1 hypothetical protein SAMN04488118_10877 [Epibacterium ulvae]